MASAALPRRNGILPRPSPSRSRRKAHPHPCPTQGFPGVDQRRPNRLRGGSNALVWAPHNNTSESQPAITNLVPRTPRPTAYLRGGKKNITSAGEVGSSASSAGEVGSGGASGSGGAIEYKGVLDKAVEVSPQGDLGSIRPLGRAQRTKLGGVESASQECALGGASSKDQRSEQPDERDMGLGPTPKAYVTGTIKWVKDGG